MSDQVKAFQLSFLLHSLMVALIVIGGAVVGPYKKEILLNFDLQKPVPDVGRVEAPAPIPSAEKNFENPAIPKKVQEKESSRPPEETPRPSSISETPPVVKFPEIRNPEAGPISLGDADTGKAIQEDTPGTVTTAREGTGTSPGIGSAHGGKEAVVTKYLNENFAYIRDRILKNISYPDKARRMDWQGNVWLSFVITTSGAVKEIKVIQSSGYPLLDRNAVKTVRDTAPFPCPPGEARLVIPITYQLE